MPIDSSLFLDVSDALGMGNPAIVEKDYYVVALLKLLSVLSSDTHSLVFSGGTALAKSGIKTHRMSEDVDIKIIPKNSQSTTSKTQQRKPEKHYINKLSALSIHTICLLLKINRSFLMNIVINNLIFATHKPTPRHRV
jgi:hypothetical protein